MFYLLAVSEASALISLILIHKGHCHWHLYLCSIIVLETSTRAKNRLTMTEKCSNVQYAPLYPDVVDLQYFKL